MTLKGLKGLSIRLLLAWTCLLCFPTSAWACPNCKNAIEANSEPMALGYGASIVFMLVVPAILVIIWSVALKRFSRTFQRATPS